MAVPEGRLTPDAVRQAGFGWTPLARRGYDVPDVERFRDQVLLEIVAANAEKAELRQEIQRLRDYYRLRGVTQGGRDPARRDPPPAPLAVVAASTPEAVEAVAHARQVAAELVSQAEAYSRELIAQARAECEEILGAHERARRAG